MADMSADQLVSRPVELTAVVMAVLLVDNSAVEKAVQLGVNSVDLMAAQKVSNLVGLWELLAARSVMRLVYTKTN